MREGFIPVPGGRVFYRIIGQDATGVPLLALHGGPGIPHDYLEPLEALADERPVVFYDQLGCGGSDRPGDLSLYTLPRFVEELAVVRRELGLERVHLLGSPGAACWPWNTCWYAVPPGWRAWCSAALASTRGASPKTSASISNTCPRPCAKRF